VRASRLEVFPPEEEHVYSLYLDSNDESLNNDNEDISEFHSAIAVNL